MVVVVLVLWPLTYSFAWEAPNTIVGILAAILVVHLVALGQHTFMRPRSDATVQTDPERPVLMSFDEGTQTAPQQSSQATQITPQQSSQATQFTPWRSSRATQVPPWNESPWL